MKNSLNKEKKRNDNGTPYIRKSILEDKLSFRKLEIFLNENIDMDVTQSYINKIWNKIEGDL